MCPVHCLHRHHSIRLVLFYFSLLLLFFAHYGEMNEWRRCRGVYSVCLCFLHVFFVYTTQLAVKTPTSSSTMSICQALNCMRCCANDWVIVPLARTKSLFYTLTYLLRCLFCSVWVSASGDLSVCICKQGARGPEINLFETRHVSKRSNCRNNRQLVTSSNRQVAATTSQLGTIGHGSLFT